MSAPSELHIERTAVALTPSQSFDASLIELCRTLEDWTAKRKAEQAASPNEFPPFNWKAARQALIFYSLYGVGMAEFAFLRHTQHAIALLFDIVSMVICLVAGSVLFLIETNGLLTKRFWRAFAVSFKKTNYPFTPLRTCLEADLTSTEILSTFSSPVLTAGEHRIAAEEAELRERLATGVGNPTLLVIISLLAGISSAWKNFHAETTIPTTVMFFGSVGALVFACYMVASRMELFQLTRCRGLLALEIARRKAGAERA